ncbi:MAG TPA: ATP-binding cassette domain-containing protein [Polaromonas sp.]|uniref:ABC transporter ATP-binding protein n=1 Tax=Polaromonas sp. TaxID=1869339 RepID=UPI002D72B8F7|nr:ATP-binding cassette domain-containing protein [Polaromonas sp.]HYW57630.1 ATP-binding cassette domain-containing protein [Polaromonas sp.]
MIDSQQLAYAYQQGSLLRFDNVNVPQGGVLVLRGASGSGKSTWLALAAGLLAPSEGDITIAGQSVKALGKAAGDAWRARTIGFLPQKLHLSAALTVHDNLAMAQWAAGQPQDEKRIAEALAALGVQDLTRRKPAQLSGGQAQRVALARAVLLKPLVILADEPTASLDDDSAGAALALLQACAAREGATLVIATHDSRVLNGLEGEIITLPINNGHSLL